MVTQFRNSDVDKRLNVATNISAASTRILVLLAAQAPKKNRYKASAAFSPYKFYVKNCLKQSTNTSERFFFSIYINMIPQRHRKLRYFRTFSTLHGGFWVSVKLPHYFLLNFFHSVKLFIFLKKSVVLFQTEGLTKDKAFCPAFVFHSRDTQISSSCSFYRDQFDEMARKFDSVKTVKPLFVY